MRFLFISLAMLSFFFACSRNGNQSDLKIVRGFWGHLSSIEDVAPSSLFLVHVAPEQVYKICISRDFLNKYSGVEQEVEASIDIWAHYIGREIKTRTDIVDLPSPKNNETPDQLLEDYISKCPAGTDLVVAESYFNDAATGKTVSNYSYRHQDNQGRNIVESFKQALFLKKSHEGASSSDQVIWRTLASIKGQKLSRTEIFELLKARGEKVFLTGTSELLTLRTIMHEIGHVWGLCDQYALAGNRTNCDANFATLDSRGHILLNKSSTMSSQGWVSPLYLSDDDITGIQKLAKRPGFQATWGEPNLSQIDVPTTSSKAIEFSQILSVQKDESTIVVRMAVLAAPGLKMQASIHDKNSDRWINYSGSTRTALTDTRNFDYSLRYSGSTDPDKVSIKFSNGEEENLVEMSIP